MTLNLSAKRKNGFWVESPFRLMDFPAGEPHIKVDQYYKPEDYEFHVAYLTGYRAQDLFTLAMLRQVTGNVKLIVVLPYLPAARADRGTPNLEIFTDFITHQVMPDQLITIDPHSQEWVEAYGRSAQTGHLTVFPVERIIRNEIQDPTQDTHADAYVGVIAPDKGAVDRATRAAHAMGVPVYRAEKTRNFETGKLDGFHMVDDLPAEGKLLIVDDICDGGGTFLGLAEATGLGADRLDLWVTHGIFSKGFTELLQNFGTIHTTDSYFSGDGVYYPAPAMGTVVVPKDHVKVHKLRPYLLAEIGIHD